jgi:hypothetical protein
VPILHPSVLSRTTAQLSFYVNVTGAPDLVPPNTPPTFPIPVIDNTGELFLAPTPFESATVSSTSLSTFPVAFPQPTTGASDRGATIDGVGGAERNGDAAGPSRWILQPV